MFRYFFYNFYIYTSQQQQKWEQFPIFKDSVNSALKRHRVDNVLRQEYREQLNNIQIAAAVGGFGGADQQNNAPAPANLPQRAAMPPNFAQQIQFLPLPEGVEVPNMANSLLAFDDGYAAQGSSRIPRMPSGLNEYIIKTCF